MKNQRGYFINFTASLPHTLYQSNLRNSFENGSSEDRGHPGYFQGLEAVDKDYSIEEGIWNLIDPEKLWANTL